MREQKEEKRKERKRERKKDRKKERERKRKKERERERKKTRKKKEIKVWMDETIFFSVQFHFLQCKFNDKIKLLLLDTEIFG